MEPVDHAQRNGRHRGNGIHALTPHSNGKQRCGAGRQEPPRADRRTQVGPAEPFLAEQFRLVLRLRHNAS